VRCNEIGAQRWDRILIGCAAPPPPHSSRAAKYPRLCTLQGVVNDEPQNRILEFRSVRGERGARRCSGRSEGTVVSSCWFSLITCAVQPGLFGSGVDRPHMLAAAGRVGGQADAE
jgi:hypothetical protein